ncbi:MAG: NAD(P)/FAD-dependent oxidoreductase [Myxococcales bacterium]|nr:NAD(P)/FAD-dependent oxidoreductase [Myxococcales bacterium]
MDSDNPSLSTANPKIVIVGGGFGGLWCAQRLASAAVEIVLIDRTNHHLFQPLLYQVAMAGLSPAEIAAPIRAILRQQRNVRVLLAEVHSVELHSNTVVLDDGSAMPFDWLVLATGVKTSYFGHPQWEKHAAGLKTVEDALEIRRRVLMAFEQAERCADPQERDRLLTFVVIGGGPTGVELAGAIAELAHTVLAQEFRHIDPGSAKVVLVEHGGRILAGFPHGLSASATEQLSELGVLLRLNSQVTAIDADGVQFADGSLLPTRTVLWGAGVRGTRLAETLGVPLDSNGRVIVGPDCALPARPTVFAIGDMASCQVSGKPLPGLCPVAMQQGNYVGNIIATDLAQSRREPFRYVDRGSMATIGRSRAIAWIGSTELSGYLAWLAWLVVHLMQLIGFRNRFVVLITWAWSYFSYTRGARLITQRSGERSRVRADNGADEQQGGQAKLG